MVLIHREDFGPVDIRRVPINEHSIRVERPVSPGDGVSSLQTLHEAARVRRRRPFTANGNNLHLLVKAVRERETLQGL